MSRGKSLLMGAFILLGLLALTGCNQRQQKADVVTISTTTSYLEAVVHDLMGDEVRVVRLAEPGSCPGHFDIRPSQVEELRHCRALLRFDFQKSLDAKIAGNGVNGPAVVEVAIRGGMCVPASYLNACRQVAGQMVKLGLMSGAAADGRIQSITERLDALGRNITNRVVQAGLAGLPVIASAHQRDFCEWLGLKVVATFRAADTAGIGEIEEAISAGKLAQIKLVVANLPEGRRTADALAQRLKARVVVFENFPVARGGKVSFDEMLLANAGTLVGTSGK